MQGHRRFIAPVLARLTDRSASLVNVATETSLTFDEVRNEMWLKLPPGVTHKLKYETVVSAGGKVPGLVGRLLSLA